MDNLSLVRLEELFFPLQEIRALPQHDPNGSRTGTQLKITHGVQPMEGTERAYWFTAGIETDDENSTNQPYSFRVEAYAVLRVTEASLDSSAELALVAQTAIPIVLGAARERIAELSSRGPWGRFLVNVMAIRPPTAISPKDPETNNP